MATSRPKLPPEAWAANVPAQMRKFPQWVAHREKRPLRISDGTAARVNDPSTWGTFEQAKGALSRYDGAGFVLTEKSGLVFVDFDHVLDARKEVRSDLEPDLRELIEAAIRETYTEISPSGTGLHAFYVGQLPPDTTHRRELGSVTAVELYDHARYSTITGELWGNAKLADVPGAIERLVSFMGTHNGAAKMVPPEAPEPERLEEIMEALKYLNPDMPYPEWLRVGMALKAGLGKDGLALWVGWSRDGSKYRPGEPEEKWRSFNGTGTSLATLVWMAEQNGWTRDGKYTSPGDVFSVLPIVPEKPTGKAPFTMFDVDEVKVVPIHWLWEPRIARGHLAVVAGDPKVGKTLMVESLAALRSQGKPLPGNAPTPQTMEARRWFLLESEDDENDTTTPRLIENGADRSKVTILNRASGSLILTNPEHLQWLEWYIADKGDVEALVISPLNNFLPGGSKLDTHKDKDIRAALMPLVALAKRLNIAVIVVAHLNKTPGQTPLYRVLGSIGLAGVARTVLLVGRKDDLRFVAVLGSNSREPDTLAFSITPSPRDKNIGVVEWLPDADVTVSAEELLTPEPGRKAVKLAGAAEWLQMRLNAGPVRSAELYEDAKRAGFAQRTLERAREAVGARAVQKRGTSGWVWELTLGAPGRPPNGAGRQNTLAV